MPNTVRRQECNCFILSWIKRPHLTKGMFANCIRLSALDLSSFDTSQVTDMDFMFAACKRLQNLDLGSFNTSSVIRMRGMFADCRQLTDLNLSSFDTSQVIDMDGIFSICWSNHFSFIYRWNQDIWSDKVQGKNRFLSKKLALSKVMRPPVIWWKYEFCIYFLKLKFLHFFR